MEPLVASSTAVLVCQGRASADGRYAVGRFDDPVARHLLDPPELEVVEEVRGDRPWSVGPRDVSRELVRWTGVGMVPRTIAIDDAIREHGATQVVILGAGLDSRAWRMDELAAATVFEVDHPASSHDKKRRLSGRPPTAGRVVAVEVDLARDPLAPPLTASGFSPATPTTWVWEGVVPYLAARAVRHTVAHIGALSATGSRLVISYQARSWRTAMLRKLMRVVFRVARQRDPLAGEPWRSWWTPQSMRRLLAPHGFEVERDDDLLTLSAGLDLPAGRESSLRNGRIVVATRQPDRPARRDAESPHPTSV